MKRNLSLVARCFCTIRPARPLSIFSPSTAIVGTSEFPGPEHLSKGGVAFVDVFCGHWSHWSSVPVFVRVTEARGIYYYATLSVVMVPSDGLVVIPSEAQFVLVVTAPARRCTLAPALSSDCDGGGVGSPMPAKPNCCPQLPQWCS